MSKILRSGPFDNAFDFDWVHRDCSVLNDKTKEFDFVNHEVAFRGFDKEVVIAQYLERFTDTIDVNRGIVVGRNKHIVHVDEQPTISELMDEQIVHHMLEGSRRIAEAEEHYQGLEEPIFHDKGGQPFMSFGDSDIIITSANVHFRKESFSFEFVDKIRNLREWVRILDCPFVNVTVVLARSFLVILFLDKEEG